MAGYREGIADNALDACDSSRRCDRRYTVSIRGPHAAPPPGVQRFSPASDPDRCQLVSRRFPEVPASFPPSRWVAGTGRFLPAGNAHLWLFGSVFVEWFESLGHHAVDCAATIARSGPTPPIP